MVEYDRVTKIYADGTTAVDNFNLKIEPGRIVVLIGPSGCGKSSILRMTNRLSAPSSGSIRIAGEDTRKIAPVDLRRDIGYVVQETGLFPHLTIEENIGTVPGLLGWTRQRRVARVHELLELGGMDPATYRFRLPAELTAGQCRRVGVLRALAAEPELILMDEPYGALDPIMRERLQGELQKIQSELKRTIIFVTHDIDEALKLGDFIVLMRKGRVEQAGTPDELQDKPANNFVESFVGDNRYAQISPDAPIDTLVEDAPLIIADRSSPITAADRLADEGHESAQVCDSQGFWKGMIYLNDVRTAAREERSFAWTLRKQRHLVRGVATVRHAAQMLRDEDAPIPIVDEHNRLQGIITDAGLARMTIARITRAKRSGT